jgi:hypothetical protein
MKRMLLSALLAIASSSAFAGAGYMCEGDGVNIHIPLGASVGLSPLGVTIDANGEVYSTDPGVGTAIVVSEAMSEGNKVMIDLANESYETVVARIRVFWAEEESDPVYGGILAIVGKGAWAITCSVG